MTDANRISYFCLGVAVGAATATFYARRSGAETRKHCQTKIQETANRLKRQAEDLRDRAVKIVERGNQGFERQVSKFSAAVDAGMRAFEKNGVTESEDRECSQPDEELVHGLA